jgi:hypothetical protein
LLNAIAEKRGWKHYSNRDYAEIIERLSEEVGGLWADFLQVMPPLPPHQPTPGPHHPPHQPPLMGHYACRNAASPVSIRPILIFLVDHHWVDPLIDLLNCLVGGGFT